MVHCESSEPVLQICSLQHVCGHRAGCVNQLGIACNNLHHEVIICSSSAYLFSCWKLVIRPFSVSYPGSGCGWSSLSKEDLLVSQLPQVLLAGHIEAFPSQSRDVISPRVLGLPQGLLKSWTCKKHLTSEAPRRRPGSQTMSIVFFQCGEVVVLFWELPEWPSSSPYL